MKGILGMWKKVLVSIILNNFNVFDKSYLVEIKMSGVRLGSDYSPNVR